MQKCLLCIDTTDICLHFYVKVRRPFEIIKKKQQQQVKSLPRCVPPGTTTKDSYMYHKDIAASRTAVPFEIRDENVYIG